MDEVVDELKPGRLDEIGFRLIPLFPIGTLTPQSACPHHDTIDPGSRLCCMVCHESGMDDHPGLRRDPDTILPRSPHPRRHAGEAPGRGSPASPKRPASSGVDASSPRAAVA